MKNYFTLDEDFGTIIQNALPNTTIYGMKSVTTGWTNIVYEVNTVKGDFFFRFPRDDFWARTIVKDYEFAKFIYGKTDFNTVKLTLLYDHGRPFSMHKKIEGTVLADKINDLTPEEIAVVSNDIAKFLFQLHNLQFDKNAVFETKEIGLNLVHFLDELLEVHVDPKDKVFWHSEDLNKKEKNCLVHGDFNSSNVLLDENNHVSGIIDFGFAGFGNKYDDIARILSRSYPENFKNEMIHQYENFCKAPLDTPILDHEIKTWTNIDHAYINYMRGIGIYE